MDTENNFKIKRQKIIIEVGIEIVCVIAMIIGAAYGVRFSNAPMLPLIMVVFGFHCCMTFWKTQNAILTFKESYLTYRQWSLVLHIKYDEIQTIEKIPEKLALKVTHKRENGKEIATPIPYNIFEKEEQLKIYNLLKEKVPENVLKTTYEEMKKKYPDIHLKQE